MKFLFIIVGLALAALAEEPILLNYHEVIGIPEAARIKRAEEAQDFDGSRIVGGSPSSLGAHPYLGGLIIPLLDGRTSKCGASLLSATKLVTAAQCWRVGNVQARQFIVVLGSTHLFSGGVRIGTSHVQLHSSYNPQNLNNDIALITITPVSFNDNIRPIAVFSGVDTFAGVIAVAAGYGATDDSPTNNNNSKRHVNLQVITNAACAAIYGSNSVLASTLCTASTGGQNICSGDQGGPLVVGSGNNRQLIGVSSFVALAGCLSGLPAGYARVNSFQSWIQARL